MAVPPTPKPDPSTYDYSQAQRTCDIVMKGGITSGVVYPHAVCELARTYRFRAIGGTSAGAIAAAAAAAAEHGRDRGGFALLAGLPGWLAADGNLRFLFQPERTTAPLFRMLLGGLGPGRRRLVRVLVTGVFGFPAAVVVGAAPGVGLALASALLAGEGGAVAGIVAGVVLALLGALGGLAAAVYRCATRALPGNGFGLCSGMPAPRGASREALTPWLAGFLDRLAGKPEDGEPLTFGELWGGDPQDPDVRLEMMTTNLTHRRPYRLPFEREEYFFHPDELRRLFPARIVEWMLSHPPALPTGPAERRELELGRLQLAPLAPLPEARDLPVVVAARLSLSFPLLLGAVPLWAVDWSRTRNRRAAVAARKWLARHAEEWEELRAGGARWQAVERPPAPDAERCWFSDGGISSNFPVHFFDAPVPRRPTFAVNLRPFHPDHPRSPDERVNSWLPKRPASGILEWWYPFAPRAGRRQLVDFLGAIVRTMQNRVDEAQMRVPGYRDRVVHIGFDEHEGGMNLGMEEDVLTALTERGRTAAEKLVERFARPPRRPRSLSWDFHRWVRYRSTMAALEELLVRAAAAYESPPELPGERSYRELVERPRGAAPAWYEWRTETQRAFARELTAQAVALGAELGERGRERRSASFAYEAPEPRPELRIAPRV